MARSEGVADGERAAARVKLATIGGVFLKMGALSFGGGVSGWMYREVVTLRGWVTQEEFMADLALSQILPGVNVANMAICIGRRLRGAAGAAVAVVSLLLAPFFAVLLLISLYTTLQELSWIAKGLDGVAAAAIGLIILIVLRGAREAASNPGSALAFLAVFICVGWLQWPMVPVVAAAAAFSIVATWLTTRERT